MQKWAAEKRIHNEDIYQDLNIELETEMLAEIAANFYKEDKIFFYGPDLKKQIKNYLAIRLSNKNLDISKVLEAIEIQQGILVERSFDIYSFSHLTIQEYLTAHFYNSPIKIHDLISNHLLDKRWREVFILIVGIGDPNDILLLMLENLSKKSIENEVLSKTINWIDKIIAPSTNFELDSCKRVFLASLLIRYKRYDSGFPNQPERIEIYSDQLLKAIDPAFYDFFVYELKANISSKEAVTILDEISKWILATAKFSLSKEKLLLIKPKMPLSKMIMGSRQAYRREIIDELYAALNIPLEISNRKRNMYKPMLEYMEGYKLLIDCAKSSFLTSTKVWEKICKNVFNKT